MSHSVVVVIVPQNDDLDCVEHDVHEALRPFDENLEVPERNEECWCVGSVAKREAREKVDEEFGTIKQARAEFNAGATIVALLKAVEDNGGGSSWMGPARKWIDDAERDRWREAMWKLDQEWAKVLARRDERERIIIASHPIKNKPDPTCGFYTGPRKSHWPIEVKEGDRYEDLSGCAGTGKSTTTYNPLSRWDWFVVGGRWHGWITGTDTTRNQYEASFADNVIPTEDYAAHLSMAFEPDRKPWDQVDRVPFSVLAPNGSHHFDGIQALYSDEGREGPTWYELGNMGWWGMTSHESELHAWERAVCEIMRAFPDHVAVAVDVHI